MKIAVLFASNRRGGKHGEIRKMISSLDLPYEYDWIELADCDISHCGQECAGCVIRTQYRCCLLYTSPVHCNSDGKRAQNFDRPTKSAFGLLNLVVFAEREPAVPEQRCDVLFEGADHFCGLTVDDRHDAHAEKCGGKNAQAEDTE